MYTDKWLHQSHVCLDKIFKARKRQFKLPPLCTRRMSGYKSIFDDAAKEYEKEQNKLALFNSFRARKDVYAFIENGDEPPVQEYVNKAKQINTPLYYEYVGVLSERKQVGYDGFPNKHAQYTDLDSRHIMMLTLAFTNIKEPINTVLEIGGGYANMVYLNKHKPISMWTIVDLPFVSELQRWCAKEYGLDTQKYRILNTNEYETLETKAFDLVIGTHSLSELSFQSFLEYFTQSIQYSKYLLYSHQRDFPDKNLIQYKRDIINSVFDLIAEEITDEGRVYHCVYKNRLVK